MQRDTLGFITACVFVGLLFLDAALCLYLHWTYGWVIGVVGALFSMQVILLTFLLSFQYIDKCYDSRIAQTQDHRIDQTNGSLVFPLAY